MTEKRYLKKLFILLLVFVIILLSAYPVITIIHKSLQKEHVLSLDNYIKAFSDRDFLIVFRNTLMVCIFVVLFSTIIGVSLAWIVERTNIPYRKKYRTLLTLPYLIPPFIAAFAWKQLLGPVGYINKIYMALFQKTEPFFQIYGFHGIVIVLTLLTYPVIYIITVKALKIMNPELEEVARISGASDLTIALKITLPMIMPAITGGMVLVFATCISNFGVPAVLGLPANFPVLTTAIYTVILDYTRSNNFAIAASLSTSLIIIGISILILQKQFLLNKNFSIKGQKLVFRHSLIDLGKSKIIFTSIASVIIILTTIAPIGVLIFDSFIRAYGLPMSFENITFKNYIDIFTMRLTLTALKNSLILAITASIITLILGFIIAYLKTRNNSKLFLIMDFIGTIPNNIPGTVLALGMILCWLKPIPIIKVSIYGTLWLIFLTYIARYMAFALRTSTGSLEQMDVSMEEVAKICGAGNFKILQKITVPILKESLMGCWILMVVPMLNELTVSILLYTSGRETIGVVAFLLMQEGAIMTASALSVLMILFVLISNYLAYYLSKKKISLI